MWRRIHFFSEAQTLDVHVAAQPVVSQGTASFTLLLYLCPEAVTVIRKNIPNFQLVLFSRQNVSHLVNAEVKPSVLFQFSIQPPK